MRQITSALAAAALAALSSAASAGLLVVDDFQLPNSTNQSITSTYVGDLTGAGNGVGGFSPYNRATTIQMTEGPANAGAVLPGSPVSKVTIGSATVPVGLLSVSNDDGANSFVQLAYTLPAQYFTGGNNLPPTGTFGEVVPVGSPVSFFFKLQRNDVPVKVQIFDNGANEIASFTLLLGANSIANGGDGIYTADLTPAQFAAIDAGGAFSLRFTGNDSWDASLDQFGFLVPEPASLALVGLALVGAGIASRRRKA